MNPASQSQDQQMIGFDRITRRYIRLDCDAWLKANSIEKEGRTRGKEEQPASDAALPDSIYEKILDTVKQRARDCKNEVRKAINTDIETLNSLTSNWEQENPEITLNSSIERECNNLESLSAQDISNLDAKRSEFEEAAQELGNFRSLNKLDRVASYPLSKVTHWAWVPVAAAVESFLGANLLGSVARGGVIEGWMVALMLTGVNIFLGVLGGLAFPYFHHVQVIRKCFGFFVLTLCTLLAFLWNVTAGHVRDVYVIAEGTGNLAAVDQAFTLAIETVMESPLPWASLPSAVLAFVGIVVFFLTFYKAYHRDDVYPGYGDRHRQVAQLRESYQYDLNTSRGRLQERRNNSYNEILEYKNRYEADKTGWENAQEDLKTMLDDYVVNLKQYNDDLDYLLAAYRDANLEARKTPAPNFFDEKFTIGDDLLEKPVIEEREAFQWGDVSLIADEGFNRLEETYKKLLERYRMLNQVGEGQSSAEA